MQRTVSPKKVYELYRMIEMDWPRFRLWAEERGHTFRSPHQVVQADEVNQLFAELLFRPPTNESELMGRLREALAAMPDKKAHEEVVQLLCSQPLGEDRAFALDYAHQHMEEVFARNPAPSLFDWGEVAVAEDFWTDFSRVLEGEELEPNKWLDYPGCYFQPREDASSAPELVTAMIKAWEGEWSDVFYNLYDWGSEEEGWHFVLDSIGFWSNPDANARCWRLFHEWNSEYSYENWRRLQRLRSIWGEGEPTRLVSLQMDALLAPWKEAFFVPQGAQFWSGFESLAEKIHKGLDYEGLRVKHIAPFEDGLTLADDMKTDLHYFLFVLQPLLKSAMVAPELSETQRGRWELALVPPSLELNIQFAEAWRSTIEGFRPRAKRAAHAGAIEAGLHGAGMTTYGLRSASPLTCCGSAEFLLETVFGYFLVQFYRFC